MAPCKLQANGQNQHQHGLKGSKPKTPRLQSLEGINREGSHLQDSISLRDKTETSCSYYPRQHADFFAFAGGRGLRPRRPYSGMCGPPSHVP
jgi:hypothetical protein